MVSSDEVADCRRIAGGGLVEEGWTAGEREAIAA